MIVPVVILVEKPGFLTKFVSFHLVMRCQNFLIFLTPTINGFLRGKLEIEM
jgi:hypothetical protein